MLLSRLDHFFSEVAPLDRGDRLVVAFSGGPDSTALLHAAKELGSAKGFEVVAAHLDHHLDPRSGQRARRAEAIADRIGAPFELGEADPRSMSEVDRGIEDWARRARYDFLERCRRSSDSRYIATAHHRDDQVETVLIRLLGGSGLEGLAAMAPRRGPLVRPLLDVTRSQLDAELEELGLAAIDDPSNRDLGRLRNLVRHHLRPALEAEHPELASHLLALAVLCRGLATGLEEKLVERLAPSSSVNGASIDLMALRELPTAVHPFALSLLHRRAGLDYPAGRASRSELARQLRAGDRIGCDCAADWRWEQRAERLHLVRRETVSERFTYTLSVPGEVAIPELGVRLCIGREPLAPWMFEGRERRAAMDLPIREGAVLTVRNRLPGDRVRPLGCRYERRLKEVLIDKGIPRDRRDRLPLLCVGSHVAWVPGVTIDESYRISDSSSPWVARIVPL